MALQRITLPHQFKPRHYQHDLNRAFFVEGKKRLLCVWHRRAGKSKNAINFLVGAAMQRVGNYYHCFPKLTQARKAIWKGIDKEGKRYLDHIPRKLIKYENKSEMLIELINGSTIQLAGADNYNTLMGGNPVGIIFDEYSLQNPLAWQYLRPVLAENGGWAMFVYTFRGFNHGWDLYEKNKNNDNWFVQKLGADQTFKNDGSPVITQDIIDEEIRGGMIPELVEQEFYCNPYASPGAYFGKEMRQMELEKRIGVHPHNPQLPVYTFWDLGVSDSTAIVFAQASAGKIAIIDYYQNNNVGMEHYAKIVKDKGLKYHYQSHYAPHDIVIKEWGSGRTRLEQALSFGIQFKVVPRTKNKQEDINALRTLLPRIYINDSACEALKSALTSYHRKYDEERKIFLDKPAHDWASHPVDACFCMAMAWKDRFENPSQCHTGMQEYEDFSLS